MSNKLRPSPFGGAEDELPFTMQVPFRSSERRRRCLPFHSINISPPLGEAQSSICSQAKKDYLVLAVPVVVTSQPMSGGVKENFWIRVNRNRIQASLLLRKKIMKRNESICVN